MVLQKFLGLACGGFELGHLGYRGDGLLRVVTVGYKWSRVVKSGHLGLQGLQGLGVVTVGYEWLRVVTSSYEWLRLVMGGYGGGHQDKKGGMGMGGGGEVVHVIKIF